jgi:hypothetical protein
MTPRNKFWFILFIIGSVSLFNIANAQTMPDIKNATPQQRAQFQTGMMKSKLNLNADQLKKVEDINLKYAEKFQPLIQGTDSRFSKMRKVKALQKEKDDELQKVFNADQFKQYQAFVADMKNKMMAKMKESN